MTNEFIPYEQALALKEIEFDEPCLAFYYNKTKFLSLGEKPEYLINKRKASYIFGNEKHDVTLAPTFSQAFRWFREKYKLPSFVQSRYNKFQRKVNHRYSYGNNTENFLGFNESVNYWEVTIDYETYEEAELACLIKLIEIVKTHI